MTADEFRRLALAFPEAEERSHMCHPDFRIHGRIFATLWFPDRDWGMVKLPPEQQNNYVTAYPDCFAVVNGAWGRAGATSVRLKAARKSVLHAALSEAFEYARAATRRSPRRKARSA